MGDGFPCFPAEDSYNLVALALDPDGPAACTHDSAFCFALALAKAKRTIAIIGLNTNVEIGGMPTEPYQARTFRRHSSDGDSLNSSQTSHGNSQLAVESAPPTQLRRVNEEGDSLPGTQDSKLAWQAQLFTMSARHFHCPVRGCPSCSGLRAGMDNFAKPRASH